MKSNQQERIKEHNLALLSKWRRMLASQEQCFCYWSGTWKYGDLCANSVSFDASGSSSISFWHKDGLLDFRSPSLGLSFVYQTNF